MVAVNIFLDVYAFFCLADLHLPHQIPAYMKVGIAMKHSWVGSISSRCNLKHRRWCQFRLIRPIRMNALSCASMHTPCPSVEKQRSASGCCPYFPPMPEGLAEVIPKLLLRYRAAFIRIPKKNGLAKARPFALYFLLLLHSAATSWTTMRPHLNPRTAPRPSDIR